MSLALAPSVRVSLLLAALGLACHESSSSSPVAETQFTAFNLGLTMEDAYGPGSLRLVDVSELRQGRDINHDGDVFDRIAHVVDLDARRVVDTGLAPGFPHSAHSPPIVCWVDETLAIAVSEGATGDVDRNGDGDTLDRVLALYDRATGDTANLGFAASAVIAADDLVGFDCPEVDQGEDLDLDGSLHDTVPCVHDRRTGETWSTGVRGAKVAGVGGDTVGLILDEALVGDRNGDGDALDRVFQVYDASARELHVLALALSGQLPLAFAHGGRWAIAVGEASQGGVDIDGDGDALDTVTFVYDPTARTTRDLGKRIASALDGVAPFVLVDWPVPGTPFASQLLWLYDAEADALVNTGLRGFARGFDARLVVVVSEEFQGVDLDRNGFLDGAVPVLYDPATGRTENLGIDGFVQPFPGRLLITSRESFARRDWNGDGDQEDAVLFTWRERGRQLVNTRLSPMFATPLGDRAALLLVSEDGTDRNGDGDGTDLVVQTYDIDSRRVRDLGLAALYLFQVPGARNLLTVFESEQGADLNGDGDQDDRVLHFVEARLQGAAPE